MDLILFKDIRSQHLLQQRAFSHSVLLVIILDLSETMERGFLERRPLPKLGRYLRQERSTLDNASINVS